MVARDETEMISSATDRALNLKELGLGPEDLLTEFLGLDKSFLFPLTLTKDRSPCVATVVGSTISFTVTLLAVHVNLSTSTILLPCSDILKYLKFLEINSIKLNGLDFSNLAAAGPAVP